MQTVPHILGSLLAQLYEQNESESMIPAVVWSRHKEALRNKLPPQAGEVRRWLMEELRRSGQKLLLLDGLDELSETCRQDLLGELDFPVDGSQILITSRDIADISECFKPTHQIRIKAKDEDVSSVVEGRLSRGSGRSFLRRCRAEPSLAAGVVRDVTDKAQGM